MAPESAGPGSRVRVPTNKAVRQRRVRGGSGDNAREAVRVKHPRITLHFTPTSGSWLNLVEVFFGIITRQAIRRGTFTSVKELVDAIERFFDGWNERCHPFVWTKDEDCR